MTRRSTAVVLSALVGGVACGSHANTPLPGFEGGPTFTGEDGDGGAAPSTGAQQGAGADAGATSPTTVDASTPDARQTRPDAGGASGVDAGAKPVASDGGSPTGLHAVMGTGGRAGQIVDQNGNVVVLHGADESGTENFCTTWGPPPVVVSPTDGPSPLTQASLTAMKKWGLNSVRIPLNEDCWLGINGVDSSVGGANYQGPILDAVNLITKTNSMYVVLDLHLSAPGTTIPPTQGAMPDVDHSATFWQQVATAYKNNGSVMFDLFNEPVMMSGTQDQQFSCWKNGSTAASSGDCPMVNFAVAGMQQLLTSVRSTGATNLVLLGGTGYASTLGLWPKYVPTDTLNPPNIAASWHVYDDQGGCTADGSTSVSTMCPSGGLGISAVMNAGYPIVVGETGYGACSGSVGQSWWPFFLSWADSQGIGFLAWSWSDSNEPALLSSASTFTAGGVGPTYQTYLGCIAGKTVTRATGCTFLPNTGCE